MSLFFTQLQDLMLNREKEHLATLIPYYETLWQHRDKLEDMIGEVDKYSNLNIQFLHDEESYYTDGKLEIFFHERKDKEVSFPDFHYEIELQHDSRDWSYCGCTPNDNGFVDNKGCCGDGCDWTAPGFNVTRVNYVANAVFNGVERDLWKLEEEWEKDLSEHNKTVKKERLKRLEDQIEKTKREIESIKKTL